MSNQNRNIRPLTIFKKCNPIMYEHLLKSDVGGLTYKSKKDQENNSYYLYAWHYSGIESIDHTKDGEEKWNPFFFEPGQLIFTHKTIITEMGRLLLTGWYYNIEDWTKEICGYVYNSYFKKGDEFNEYKYTEVIKHIRDNVGYYYNRPDYLKLYILENFFGNELKTLLPPRPKELQDFDDAMEFLQTMDKNLLRKDKNYYKKRALFLEQYVEHLQDSFENQVCPMDEGEFQKKYDRENEEFWKGIREKENQYRQQIMKQLPEATNKILN